MGKWWREEIGGAHVVHEEGNTINLGRKGKFMQCCEGGIAILANGQVGREEGWVMQCCVEGSLPQQTNTPYLDLSGEEMHKLGQVVAER